MDINQLLKDIEDEYELYLQQNDKPSLKLIQYLKAKYSFSTLDAKTMAKEGALLFEYLKKKDALKISNELSELDAVCILNQTGDKYLNEYLPSKVEECLLNNDSNIKISNYYTTPEGGILFDIEGTTYASLIEDNNLSKSCRRYLIENGQVKI